MGTQAAFAGMAESTSLFDLNLEQLTQIPVVTASRHYEALDKAPAIVNVIEGEDLRRHGYRSVAEALSLVPGFYVSTDLVGQYETVRGISSGPGIWGRTLKVLLDGQPLGSRSDSVQFLGPELIPVELIDRIEVVRGPASALYGANAYLAVINIITRNSFPMAELGLRAGEMVGAGPSAGVEALASNASGPWSTVAAAAGERDNRSGLSLPASSPHFSQFAADPESRDDLSKPRSGYARLRYQDAEQSHTLNLHMSELAADGSFLAVGTLQHDNQFAVRQNTLGWQSEWTPAPSHDFRLLVAHAWGGTAPDEHLSLGLVTPIRRPFGYREDDVGLEAHLHHGSQQLVAGLDGAWDEESLEVIYGVNTASGGLVPLSPVFPLQLFRDIGSYLQYQWLPDNGWSTSLNWRHDNSNRYGQHNSYRFGLGHDFSSTLSGKLLYGTSYKAPNAFELHSPPFLPGGIIGNPQLVPESAASTDAQLLWQASEHLSLTVTAFHLSVNHLIALEPFGANLRWTNRGSESGNGFETEWRWRQGPHALTLATSFQDATVKEEKPLTPTITAATAGAPRLLLSGEYLYRLPHSEYGVESRYASDQRATDINISLNADNAYVLPAYAVWRVHAMREWGQQRLILALDNVFDRHYTEAGFGGVDTPSLRRTLWLSWFWQWEKAP